MSQPALSRREILMGARYLAATPLIGTAMAQTPFQVKAVSKLKGSAKSVVIPTHEFAGPNGAPWLEERLDFPASWDLQVMDMAGHNLPVLTPRQIADQSANPIGTKPLRELAEGKKMVAISTGTFFCDQWEDVIARLRELHPGDAKVAVYPYAGMQHQEIELDG